MPITPSIQRVAADILYRLATEGPTYIPELAPQTYRGAALQHLVALGVVRRRTPRKHYTVAELVPREAPRALRFA